MNLPIGFTVVEESEAHLVLEFGGVVDVHAADDLLACGMLVLHCQHDYKGCRVGCGCCSFKRILAGLPE